MLALYAACMVNPEIEVVIPKEEYLVSENDFIV